jgi:malate dehydrogenase (oxaloacetate-decarboxylating)(NADP+)
MSTEFSARQKPLFTDQEALDFHRTGKPGKIEIAPTKPLATQRDLSLAYSPGVAIPVLAIAKDPETAYDYTAKGNMVAVITNGTAILGMGNLGALAAKPVMEGKAALFKRFADIDSIDLEVDTENPDEFINCVRYLGSAFGGINLEDIKAPECFIIEDKLREVMNVPVFHDDQHGTAIIIAAGFINALELTGRDIKTTQIVCNGAGAAALASLKLLVSMGVSPKNIILCDSKGPIYTDRQEGMNQWKSAFASDTDARSLGEAMVGADMFLGLSVKGALTTEMVAAMSDQPIIFAMANPDPEITPEEVAKVRNDAIMATGRSDYPNQVNNVLGFPYIFRGALDVRAREINEEMKIAAAYALADLAREEVPDEVASAYHGAKMRYGRNYIIPVPFDPRLISAIPAAVAKAAMDSGVAGQMIADFDDYKARLSARLDPVAGSLQSVFDQVKQEPKCVVFAEGEEEQVISAAFSFASGGLGKAILVGRDDVIEQRMKEAGLEQHDQVEIVNARLSDKNFEFAEHLFQRQQRNGVLMRDCQRLVNTDRNVFAACVLAFGDADAMITGVTRNNAHAFEDISRVISPKKDQRAVGVTMAISRGRTVLVADTTTVDNRRTAQELADIAVVTAGVARRLGYEPRVAMLAYSSFGYPKGVQSDKVREAVEILDSRHVDFEYDGEMTADVALNRAKMAAYPFCRLSAPANILIMPGFASASIAIKMLQELGGVTVIGPLLVGLEKPVQIVPMNATSSELVNMAAIAAYDLNP